MLQMKQLHIAVDFYRSRSFLQCFILERLAFIVLSLLNFYGCHNANLFFWCSLYVLGLDIGPDFLFYFGQYLLLIFKFDYQSCVLLWGA